MSSQSRQIPPAGPDEDRQRRSPTVELCPVDHRNWRACADLSATEAQQTYVAPVTRYLALCAYDNGPWQPAALTADDTTVGFVMHAVDPADHSFWIGGLVIDQVHQRRGYGRAAVNALIDQASREGHSAIALSYQPANSPARALYSSLGFIESGETEDDEVVARLILDQPQEQECTEPSR
jgi:diamine N-acetyltransferase